MGRRNDVLGVTGAETMIGAGMIITGNLNGEGDMMIDGTLTGEIKTAGDVTIGVNGRIKAPIHGLNVTIAGSVQGSIVAEGEVTIRETGRVTGDITAAGLAIVSGGLFNGRSLIRQQHELELPETNEEA